MNLLEVSEKSKLKELDLLERPRRLRKTSSIRSLVQETHLLPSQLVAPLFIKEGNNLREAISSMPFVYRFSIDEMIKEIGVLKELGIKAVNLFACIPESKKNPYGEEALREGNLLSQAVIEIKNSYPDVIVMADVALDPFTDHGHDGLLSDKGYVLNDETVAVLQEMSILLAKSGVDIVAPSDMMDGRILAIRRALDKAGYSDVAILSYAAKYASSFYGPFREALASHPKAGDKKSYQMNPANRLEALREATLDTKEGADLLLVKPALAYLDVLSDIKKAVHIPVGAYHVSGEYAMVMAAHEKGWLHGPSVMMESLLSIKRAGADFILTYAAKIAAQQLVGETDS